MSTSMCAAGSPMILGAKAWEPGTWIGLGILFYGILYTLAHDGLVHQRWFRWVPRRGYARRLVQAHRLHQDRKSTRLNSVNNAQLVCRLLLEKKNKKTYLNKYT